MKHLYESILDDEEELIERSIKDSLWSPIYELLRDKKENEAIKILNSKFKPFKSGEWLKYGSVNGVENILTFHKQGAMCNVMLISNVRDKRQLKFSFYKLISHDDVRTDTIKKDFYKSYKISYDDFKNKFKPNLIKELDLKKADSFFDEWIMEL